MLKASSPLVIPVVSWASIPPEHDIQTLLVSPTFNEIVTGGSDGILIIWSLENRRQFWPKWMCYGHRGSIRNIGYAHCDEQPNQCYFFSHSSNNELALWSWKDGMCIDFKLETHYRHTTIKSYKPIFTDSRLLICGGAYPCIVVMHALQLSILFTLSSKAQPDWIADFSIFTHASLKQEVVLGVTSSGSVTVWTLTGDELFGQSNQEHESRQVSVSSRILQIHCCQQMPRLVLLVCATEWRILDAIDCSTLIGHSEAGDVRLVGGSFFHKEFITIHKDNGEISVIRLPKDLLTSQTAANSLKFNHVITLKSESSTSIKHHQFHHFRLTKSCRPNLKLLGIQNAASVFLLGYPDGSIRSWCLTAEQLVAEAASKVVILPFLSISLAEVWSQTAKIESSADAFSIASSTFEENEEEASMPVGYSKVTCCICVYSIVDSLQVPHPQHQQSQHICAPLPPRLVFGFASGDLLITRLSDFARSLFLPKSEAGERSKFTQYRLSGHKGPVLSLLHPFSFHPSTSSPFRPSMLISGGADYSVRVWDLDPVPPISARDYKTGARGRVFADPTCLGVFYNHAAPVISLSIGPPSIGRGMLKTSFLSSCIASVAVDGTVCVLSPHDRHVVIRARTGSGGSPGLRVHAISWRVAEMLLFILAEDGSLSIWDLASGQLDRYEMPGPLSDDLLQTSCHVKLIATVASPSTSLLSFNVSPSGPPLNTNSTNQSASAGCVGETAPSSLRLASIFKQRVFRPPLLLQTVGGTSAIFGGRNKGPAAFVFHFDVEAIINNLLYSAMTESVDENVPQPSSLPSDQKAAVESPVHPIGLFACGELLRLLVSLIYPWGLQTTAGEEAALETQIRQALGLGDGAVRGHGHSYHFGCLSKSGCLTLSMPGSVKDYVTAAGGGVEMAPGWPASLSMFFLSSSISSNLCLAQMSIAEAVCSSPVDRLAEALPSAGAGLSYIRGVAAMQRQVHAMTVLWVRECISTRLLALLAPAPVPQGKPEVRPDCSVLKLHRLMIFWQAKCLQIRYAARTLIYAYLDLLPPVSWRNLVNLWSVFLPQRADLVFTIAGSPFRVAYPSQPPPAPVSREEKPKKAADCVDKLSLILHAARLDGSYFESSPHELLTEEASSLQLRLTTCAILTLSIMATRQHSRSLSVSAEVAARDLCSDMAPPSSSSFPLSIDTDSGFHDESGTLLSCTGLAVPFYGGDVRSSGLSKQQQDQQLDLLNLFDDADVARTTASCLMALFDLKKFDSQKNRLPHDSSSPSIDFLSNGRPMSPDFHTYKSPVRRAAIDLLARGFAVWEPFLDTAQVLTYLLALSAEADRHLTDFKLGQLLSESADLARSARQALWCLAYSRPHLVVLNLSLMLRRLGANLNNVVSAFAPLTQATGAGDPVPPILADAPSLRVVMSSPALAAPIYTFNTNLNGNSNSGQISPNMGVNLRVPVDHAGSAAQMNKQSMPLLRARSEVLRLFADMCERRPTDLLPILPELVEVIIVSVDRTRLKERGLDVTFPALRRFCSVSSHTRAQKVCVGGTNGMLIFLDFKTGRYYSTQGHQAPVTAVTFNSDGRQLASFCLNENKLRTWQLSSTGLFGMGGQQVKALQVYPVRPLAPPSASTTLPTPPPITNMNLQLEWPEPNLITISLQPQGNCVRKINL